MPTTSLSKTGYAVYKKDLTKVEISALKKDLTIKPFQYMEPQGGKPTIYKYYVENDAKIYMPKYYGLCKYGEPDIMKISDGKPILAEFKGELRPEQEEPVTKYVESCKDNRKLGGILNMKCASGKTVMAINIIARMKVKTLIIVHKEFLMNQWEERLSQFMGNYTVGRIQGSKINVDADIVIGMLQSVSMRDYDPEIFKDFGLLIVDETHHIPAEVFSRACFKVNCKYTLGLSATLQRGDGLTKVITWFLGDIVFKTKDKKDNALVKVSEFYDESIDYNEEFKLADGKPMIPKMLTNICNFGLRNDMIVKLVVDVYKKEPNRQVLVLSARRGHLVTLEEKLKNGFKQANIEKSFGYYVGGMKQKDLDRSEKVDVILGTVTMISEGFDIKSLNTLILTTPLGNVEQSAGRILRAKESEREYMPLIVDVVDRFSVFPNQYKKRGRYYKKSGFVVEMVGGDGKANPFANHYDIVNSIHESRKDKFLLVED